MDDRRRPRVLMLTSTLPRWEGDSEPRFVLDLAQRLDKDFEIELLAPHALGAARSEVLEGVPVTRFRYWIQRWQSVAYEGGISWRLTQNPLRLFQVPFFLWSQAWHLVRRLRREPRVDLVHAHWIVPQGLVTVLVRGLSGRFVPVLCTSHGGDLFALRGRFWKYLKKLVLRNCDAVTVVSNAMAEAATKLAAGVDPVVIPMGTDLRNRFIPATRTSALPVRNLVFVGRLVEKKGVKYLLEAMVRIVAKHPDTRLKIIGHGPLRASLEGDVQQLRLGKQVMFVGPVPHHQLPAHYQAAEVSVFPFVQTSSGDQEGFGLVMVEAMGCSCAVVASDLPAVRDIVQHGETGVLVPPGQVSALANAIESLIEDPELAYELARKGRVHALSNFDWSISQEKFRKLFDGLIEAADGKVGME